MKPFEAVWNGRGLEFGDRRDELLEFARDNPRMRYLLKPLIPEGRNKRKFYFGAVLKLWAFLDGANYRSHDVIMRYHEIAKLEFLGTIEVYKGITYRIPGSTVGQLDAILEKVIDYLVDNYGINPLECLDPAHYKDFRDRVYSSGEFDTYIDYLLQLKKLKKP